ncbi:MAG: MarR family transcriptional regulator [Bacteroidota bacterium]
MHDNLEMILEQEIQQTRFSSIKQKVTLNILFTAGWLRSNQTRLFKEHGISGEQFNVLRILRGQKGNPIGVNAIQERMLDKNSNASRLIDKLKEKNLVERVGCKNDRRSVEVFITEAGSVLLKQMDVVMEEEESRSIHLSVDDAEQLNHLLDKLRTQN